MRSLFLGLLLAGCGPKIDPLAPMAAELKKARREQGQGPAHVRVALSRSATEALIRIALGADKPLMFPVMMGTTAKVSPTLRPVQLTITESTECPCPRANLAVQGTVDVEISGLLGTSKIAEGLGFRAEARGAAKLALGRAGKKGARVIALEPVRKDPWELDIRLDRTEGFLNDKLVANQVTGPVIELLSKPIPLFTVPATLPIQPAKVQLEVADDPLGALWLIAPPGDEIAPPHPQKGWAVATSEANALAGMRAVVVNLKQNKKWKIEPTSLTVDPSGFTADIRVHKVARKAKYRDYHIDGSLSFSDTIEIVPESVVETGKHGWAFSLVGPFVKGQVRKRVMGAEIEFPAKIERNIGQTPTTWTVQGLRSKNERIVVYGSVE